MVKILAEFKLGDKGLIARNTSDRGAWVVPARNADHQARPAEGWHLVEIQGTTANGKLRFAKVLFSTDSILQKILQRTWEIVEVYANPLSSSITGEIEGQTFCIRLYGDEVSSFSLNGVAIGSQAKINGTPLLNQVEEARTQKSQGDEETKRQKTEWLQTLMQEAVDNPKSARFDTLNALIEEGKNTFARVAFKQLGELGEKLYAYSSRELKKLVDILSGGEATVYFVSSVSEGMYTRNHGEALFSLVIVGEHKLQFVHENPLVQIHLDDPKFLQTASEAKGRVVGKSISYEGYGSYRSYDIYEIVIGGLTFYYVSDSSKRISNPR